MDIDSGLAFIRKAFEKEEDAKLWDRYLVDYSHMNSENYINYNDYKNALMENVTNVPTKTKEENLVEINQKVEKIINLTLKGGEEYGV